jgi:acetyl-CoA carboxylase beta subunit
MASPGETYREAILRACEAHLARVQAARDQRVLVVAKARKFEHASRNYRARSAAYARAKKAYDKAIRRSEAQRAKDEAIALATFQATGEVLGTT